MRSKPCSEIDIEALASWDGKDTLEKLLVIVRDSKTCPITGFGTGHGNDAPDEAEDGEAEHGEAESDFEEDPTWD